MVFSWLRNRLPWPVRWLLLVAMAYSSLFFAQGLWESTFHFSSSVGWGSVAIENFEPTRTESRALHLLAELEELTVAPIGVPKITTAVNWWRRIGLDRMDPFPGTEMYRTLYSPNALFRYRSRASDGKWHHWVYLSGMYGFPSSRGGPREWEAAFDELVRHHGNDPRRSSHPAANNARFHYLSCVNNMLCRLFVTRGPALIHFTTGALEGRLETSDDRLDNFDPISLRIIELPLSPQNIRLPPGVFPSPLNQLRSLTENPDAWRFWKPETPLDRISTRLRQVSIRKAMVPQSAYGLLIKMETSLPHAFSTNRVAGWLYEAGWLTATVAQLFALFGPEQFAAVLYETFPKLALSNWKEKSEQMERKQLESVKEIVLTFYGCMDGDVGKMAQIPEVVRIIERLRHLLPEEMSRAIENGDPGMRRYCRRNDPLAYSSEW
jgi:hypothetical protein